MGVTSLRRIGTHDGTFHADEALACFLLRQTEAFRAAEIVRTRGEDVLKTLDVVVDVGAEYDPERMRFDHHQRGFTHTLSPAHAIKLSSAGLIYKHFGREVIAALTRLPPTDAHVETIFNKVYTDFVECMDAIDNGIHEYPSTTKPLYRNNTHLSARVARLNPAWNDPASPAEVQERFYRAMELTGAEFVAAVRYTHGVWLPARDIVKSALLHRRQVDRSGRVLMLEQFCPWKDHLFELEEEMGLVDEDRPLYVLYADTAGPAKNWRVQAVPPSIDSFECRKALPQAWRGLRDDELSRMSGINECIFVHASGFIGGNRTEAGALEMARKALSL